MNEISLMTAKPAHYGSIDRALTMLEALVYQRDGIGTIALSRKLNMSKSTVSRLLKVLVSHRLVEQNPVSKKYSLGGLASEIGRTAVTSINDRILSVGKPHIDGLRDWLSEPVALEVFSGSSTVILYLADVKRQIRVQFHVGMRLPSRASAGAKAILAFSSHSGSHMPFDEKFKDSAFSAFSDDNKYQCQLLK